MVIFFIMYMLTTMVVGKTIQKNNHVIIDREVKNHSYNLSLYLKQYIKSNGIEATPIAFENSVTDIGTILSNKFDERIIIYSPDGDLLFDSIHKEGELENKVDKKEDLFMALKGDNAYSIVDDNDEYLVSLSLAVNVDDKTLGVVRYFFDYSYLNNISKDLFRYISAAIVVVFLLLFILIFMLLRRITKPVITLSNATKLIAQGDFDHNLYFQRNDEIGELAYNFNLMKDKIKDQIEEIRSERDNLARIQKHRKSFFDNVTHEMKTPLTIISGYTQILQEHEIEDKDFIQRTLGNIKNETDRLHSMILELLDIAKAESNIEYELEELDISKLVKDVNKSMRMKAKRKNIEIIESLEDDIKITGNQPRMRQVLVNLIDNAIKYSEHNTSINVILYTNSSNCYIEIVDEGVGISDVDICNLFEPFFRVDKSMKESSGLGLYIVKAIMERHNGNIDIDSIKGEGTKVSLKIPLKKFTKCQKHV